MCREKKSLNTASATQKKHGFNLSNLDFKNLLDLFINSVGWQMTSVQWINANITLFYMFDKLLDSDAKNGASFVLGTGWRTVLLSCL